MIGWFAFLFSAALASVGAWLFTTSPGDVESQCGLVLLVFFGLAAIAVPNILRRYHRHR